MMARHGLLAACVCLAALALLAPAGARAAAAPAAAAAADDDDASRLFAQGTKALHEGRAADAIGAFEALADRGVVDPVASYDRGLAYAMRVRIGAEVPGDLGRAAHGFEEARDLSHDPRLVDDASRALALVRSEVVRRRTRAGQPVEVDPARSLARTVAGLLGEDTWSVLAEVSSALLALALFVRWLSGAARVRVGGAIAAGVAAPALALSTAMTLAARHDRRTLREAVVVSADARPSDERGITVPGATPLPEGARLEVLETHDARSRVRFGAIEAWVPSADLRPLARAG
jgi:hypothetical protein